MINWDAVGAIAELLGAAGVIVSLLYLASQIRQNSRVVQASTAQALADSAQERLLAVAQSPSLAGVVAKMREPDAEPSPEEWIQGIYFRNAVFKGFENLFFQYRQGLITEDAWLGWQTVLRGQFNTLRADEWWSSAQRGFDPGFRACIERLRQENAA